MKKSTMKKVTTLAMTFVIASALVGCGGEDKNSYVAELNAISEEIGVSEEESIQITSSFGANPTNDYLREEYANALTELAEQYLSYGDLAVIDSVKEEHDVMVEAATAVATVYIDMAEVIMDEEVDFGTNAGVMSLVDVAVDSDTIATEFSEAIGALVDLLNE